MVGGPQTLWFGIYPCGQDSLNGANGMRGAQWMALVLVVVVAFLVVAVVKALLCEFNKV